MVSNHRDRPPDEGVESGCARLEKQGRSGTIESGWAAVEDTIRGKTKRPPRG